MTYRMLGLMSGTSLDGLDLCRCDLHVGGGRWSYDLLAARTVAYEPAWRRRLDAAIGLPRDGLAELDEAYGRLLGTAAREFLAELGESAPVVVASHGHTVHHEPDDEYTRQVGDPRALAEASGCRVVADFRTGDVALGGQGAPLVPAADALLFGEYAACVNLGGFANFSYEAAGRRLASDVTVCNLLLDRLAARVGLAYDEGGRLASTGRVDASLLGDLDAEPFFARPTPKSLGREWFEARIWPQFSRKLDGGSVAVPDALATALAHVGRQLGRALRGVPAGSILVTGGGAHNATLLRGFRQNVPHGARLAAAGPELTDYKEALAFACLGALRLRGEVNVLATVTGARRDSCAGVIAEPPVVAL